MITFRQKANASNQTAELGLIFFIKIPYKIYKSIMTINFMSKNVWVSLKLLLLIF